MSTNVQCAFAPRVARNCAKLRGIAHLNIYACAENGAQKAKILINCEHDLQTEICAIFDITC